MIKTCEDCSLQTCDITDGQLAAGWFKLMFDDKTREKLASDELAAFDSPEARASTDPAIRKMATGRAIALCFQRRSDLAPNCPLTALYEYAHIDDANLPVKL
ncbi:MAG: hypothetical protein ABIR37_00215 [Candidatus Saccharimonadales bacterium]